MRRRENRTPVQPMAPDQQEQKYQEDHVNELIIVHGNEEYLTNYLNEYDFSGITVTLESWNEDPNFAKQVNHGVSISKSNWCSILEFDDEYSNIWSMFWSSYIYSYYS